MQAASIERHRGTDAVAALALALACADVVWRLIANDYDYTNWSDRDLYRAARFWQDLPQAGAEMNYGMGGRVPGGAYYLLLWLGLLPRGEPDDVYRLLTLLDGAAMGGVAWAAWRLRGPLAGGLTALVYVSSSGARFPLIWLWNPTALPVFTAMGLALLVPMLDSDRRWAWFAWAAALGVGAQMHMTGAAWLVFGAAALALEAPRTTLRRLPWMLAGWAAVSVPFLLIDAARGWDNTRLLLYQAPLRSLPTGEAWGFRLDELVDAISRVLPGLHPRATPWVRACGVAGVLLGLASLVGLGTRLRSRHIQGRVVRVVAAVCLILVVTPAVHRGIIVEERYLLATVPGFALLAGLGLSDIGRWVGSRTRMLPAALVLTLLAASLPVAHLVDRVQGRGSATLQSWRVRTAVHDLLMQETGWTIEEVAGRTGEVHWSGDHYLWSASAPIRYRLHREGTTFPGSLRPPCALIFGGQREPEPIGQAALAAVLGRRPDEVAIQRTLPVPGGAQAVLYELSDGWCPTSLTSRYVLLDEEVPLKALHDQLSDGQVVPFPAPATWTGRAVAVAGANAPDRTSLKALLGVWFQARADGLHTTLHSIQLRGIAYNQGWLEDAQLSDLDLVLRAEDGSEEQVTPLVRFPVGPSRVATPLTLSAVSLPEGAWRIGLRGHLGTLPDAQIDWPSSDVVERAFDVDLDVRWVDGRLY